MVGYTIGAVIAMALGEQRIAFQISFCSWFFSFCPYRLCSCIFEVQTAGMYERLKYAVIIRAIGMMILYALTAAYANQRMRFQIPFYLDLHHAHRAYGAGTRYWRSYLFECAAGTAATLHHRYAQNVDLLNPGMFYFFSWYGAGDEVSKGKVRRKPVIWQLYLLRDGFRVQAAFRPSKKWRAGRSMAG